MLHQPIRDHCTNFILSDI